MTDLLPCPFCGQRLIKNGPFSKRHADCLVHPHDLGGIDYGRCPSAGFRVFSNDPARIATWNLRAAPASPESGPSQALADQSPSSLNTRIRELEEALRFYRDRCVVLSDAGFHLAASPAPANATWDQYARSRLKWLAGQIGDLARARSVLTVGDEEDQGVSVAESGSTASPKSDGPCKSEGGR